MKHKTSQNNFFFFFLLFFLIFDYAQEKQLVFDLKMGKQHLQLVKFLLSLILYNGALLNKSAAKITN